MLKWLSSIAYAGTFMPLQGTAIAGEVDALYSFLLWSSLISFVLIVGGMSYFIVKFKRRSNNDKTAYITHNHVLEFIWSFIPFLIMMVIFGWGWKIFHDIKTPPKDAMEVFIKAKKWQWEAEHKNGLKEVGEVHVPVGRPVKLVMTSEDVLHSFYIPSFRIKQDLVPGMYTYLWFDVKEAGTYQVFCAEYCGLSHSGMMAKVVAVPEAEYNAFIDGKAVAKLSPVELGKKLFETRSCSTCHSTDGTIKVGPSMKGFMTRKHEFEGGATFDPASGGVENYIRESVLEPTAKVVKGFPPAMPPFKGSLSDEEISALIEYIKSEGK